MAKPIQFEKVQFGPIHNHIERPFFVDALTVDHVEETTCLDGAGVLHHAAVIHFVGGNTVTVQDATRTAASKIETAKQQDADDSARYTRERMLR